MPDWLIVALTIAGCVTGYSVVGGVVGGIMIRHDAPAEPTMWCSLLWPMVLPFLVMIWVGSAVAGWGEK